MGVSLTEWLLNFGLGGVIIFLIATGALVPGFIYKEAQRTIERLTDALSVERQRNTDLQTMATTGAKALDALASVAEEQRARRREEAMPVRAAALPPGGDGRELGVPMVEASPSGQGAS